MFPALINVIDAEICHNFSSFQILKFLSHFPKLTDLHASYSLISYLCFHSHALPQQSPASAYARRSILYIFQFNQSRQSTQHAYLFVNMGQQQSVDVSRDLPSPIVPPPLPPSRQDDGARSATSSMAIPLAKLFSYRKLRKSGHLRHQNKNTGSISYFSTSPVHSFIIWPILVLDYQQESTSIY